MNFSMLADIQSAFESFFASLSSSVTYNLLFFLGLGVEIFFVALFAIKSRFSYESRMRRSLDELNRWLFKHKSLDKDNIKEFTELVKKAPKRLNLNWQQYILYREKAPSQYMSVENIIEKPLRTSSFAANIKNLAILSGVWALITFVIGISNQNVVDTIINATMLIIASLVPLLICIICTVAVMIMNSRKNSNLDELYQNLHLFSRFIDNACVDLPQYIDYSLLFTAREIDKGIPALREFLEARARKEKEEFDKIAKEDATMYEQYDFEGLGIDGQNILERAMHESESYLSKRDKTLAKIAQIEATIESLNKNFENIQKDFQKRMQVSKENIERLRQQQEATTNRIESNFLRKQQNQEIAKQEKEEADFEQQKRRYLVEKSEYEDVIKNLNEEIEVGRSGVEKAMMSEYESFYLKLFNTAVSEAEDKVKNKLASLAAENQEKDANLTEKEVQLKRVIDENENLKHQLGIDYQQIDLETASFTAPKEEKEQKIESQLISPQAVSLAIQQHIEADKKKDKNSKEESLEEKIPSVEQSSITPIIEPQSLAENEIKVEPIIEPIVEEVSLEEISPVQEPVAKAEDIEDKTENDDFDFVELKSTTSEKEVKTPATKTKPTQTQTDAAPKRGRPKKGEEKSLEEMIGEKRGRGRPRKPVEEKVDTAPKKRGRPVGSTKKPKVEPTEKRGRGRPKKQESLTTINKKIDDEQKRQASLKTKIDAEIKKAIAGLEAGSSKQDRRDEILAEINSLKTSVANLKNGSATLDAEKINKKIEELMAEIKLLND